MSESTVSNPETRTRRPSYLLQAWLVIFLSALYAVILVSLQINLSGKIEANKKKKTFEQIPLLVEGADPAKTRELSIMGTDGKNTILADDIAAATGTINYEIVCAFGQRLPKVYVK